MTDRDSRMETGTSFVLALSGQIDLHSSPKVRPALLQSVAAHDAVVVDLSRVDYIDSSGVASLVEALQAARARHSAFTLAQVSRQVMAVLALARLDQVFTITQAAPQGPTLRIAA